MTRRPKRKKKSTHPMDQVRRHPRWGATPAQAARNQRERERDNRIFELEQAVELAARGMETVGAALAASARALRNTLASGKAP